MKNKEQLLILISSFLLGIALYIIAVLSTPQLELTDYNSLTIILITTIAGLVVLLLGYVMVAVISSVASLRLADIIARLTKTKQVIEIVNEKPQTIRQKLQTEYFMLLMPALIFIISTALAWDAYNLHDSRTSIFYPILHWLDVLAEPPTIAPIAYSVDIILVMIFLVAIAGFIPALILPYFRKFKITGVNSGPFHTTLLTTVLSVVISLGAILTIIGLVYETLWVGKGPNYYHYIIPVMLGLSIHYTIGAYLGREKSEKTITKTLEEQSRKRIVQGTVYIRGHQQNQKP
ncbi:MAG TPA: hypothetical protein VMS95_02200 [Candidatus Krumholzibacteriaceae bacterium]|nr:hypothetical protein [Candidatus Krumholzibacteriaceae bacterium]